MEPRFAVLTLGVDDLERACRFYHDGLGFASKGIVGVEFENGEVAFFEMKNGVTLYSRKNLGWDANVTPRVRSSVESSIGHNVKDTSEVD